jgi:hypothetical protein
MVDYIPSEKATPIRMPSVANLMIDTKDRNRDIFSDPGNFTIQKNQSLVNGYFTRLATTEVVLEWGVPNISNEYANHQFAVDVSGVTYVVGFDDGQYNTSQVLDYIVRNLNALQNLFDFSIVDSGGVYIHCETVGGVDTNFTIEQYYLADQLGLEQSVAGNNFPVGGQSVVDLRWYSYLDFTSPELTYCQDVKDSSTNIDEKNVLCRYYLCWDNPPQNDKYGFPILLGYSFFTLRRMFSPAKQLKWEPNLPIGNLSFQLFAKTGQVGFVRAEQKYSLVDPAWNNRWGWLMTIQVSEV